MEECAPTPSSGIYGHATGRCYSGELEGTPPVTLPKEGYVCMCSAPIRIRALAGVALWHLLTPIPNQLQLPFNAHVEGWITLTSSCNVHNTNAVTAYEA